MESAELLVVPLRCGRQAGEVLFIPAGTFHEVRNVGSGNAAELATYIVEKGKPLLVLAK
jgi:quercetin dioxygenase-like cupin family protein